MVLTVRDVKTYMCTRNRLLILFRYTLGRPQYHHFGQQLILNIGWRRFHVVFTLSGICACLIRPHTANKAPRHRYPRSTAVTCRHCANTDGAIKTDVGGPHASAARVTSLTTATSDLVLSSVSLPADWGCLTRG